jgi:hypothetical protein
MGRPFTVTGDQNGKPPGCEPAGPILSQMIYAAGYVVFGAIQEGGLSPGVSSDPYGPPMIQHRPQHRYESVQQFFVLSGIAPRPLQFMYQVKLFVDALLYRRNET